MDHYIYVDYSVYAMNTSNSVSIGQREIIKTQKLTVSLSGGLTKHWKVFIELALAQAQSSN